MDTADLIIQFSAGDFADATRSLLTKGEYWQDIENEDLANVINGMAKDFKQTHDDIELSLLTELVEQQFGWKIRDYQSLLTTMGSNGVVYDDISNPNLIKIDLFSYDNDAAFKALEAKRLPHTEFHWLYPFDAQTKFEQATALTIKPEFSSQLELEVEAQFLCITAITWQLEIGDPA
ncbi:hypothetical protein [uncultured Vibrio sp.]|uniref:hypothetical protein n=1 Tax=uncultured Vibrio sp. TaxID=114054 RepID=UPI0025DB8432|nr:hypothetical protein [uncultured Vibrio sp.]